MNERLSKIAAAHSSYMKNYHKYKMIFWDKFDYSFLSRNIMYYKKKGKFQSGTWNDIIIAADTETSKHHEAAANPDQAMANHVVAWTISMRAYHQNICTIYGTKPSEFIEALKRIRSALKGDEIYIYFHNLSYDHCFLRLFLYKEFGTPVKEINTKPHYPIYLKFENGIIIKDSLILAGCKLEKWAEDLNVNHKKAVGSWDYEKIRDQGGTFTRAELRYIENDTLALVECLDAVCINLNKNISTIPYTATGIPREELRERAKKHKGHQNFKRQVLSFEQMEKVLKLYHGGYSHANRYYIGDIMDLDNTKGADFVSSYPFCALAFKYPGYKFNPLGKDVKPDYILRNMEDYAFIFRASFINIRLKDELYPMPALQASKCQHSINMETDNGRVLKAGYVSIYLCDPDLEVIAKQYTWDEASLCTEVEVSSKEYLPRWFTDYVYELFEAKCRIKPFKKTDPVNYSLAKSRLNSLYGLCVQSSFIKESFKEVTEAGWYKINREGDEGYFESGDYRIDFDTDLREQYDKYIKSPNAVLPYIWGTYITAYAFRNLFLLGECVTKFYKKDGSLAYPFHWFYSDTDSCYSDDWNMKKLEAYNQHCKDLLLANGYGPVIVDGKENWLGIAELDKESEYSEFVFLGSKRYAGRCIEDGKLHITVAGVPKNGSVCLEDDLSNFTKDFIFDGKRTGKKGHYYILANTGIYTDEWGNEIGDSIDLKPCDYALDAVDKFEYLLTDDYMMPILSEEDFDLYDQ